MIKKIIKFSENIIKILSNTKNRMQEYKNYNKTL